MYIQASGKRKYDTLTHEEKIQNLISDLREQENETQDNIEFDVPKRPGNGGGMVSTVIKPLDCLVIGVHWPRKGLDTAKRKYLEVLKKIIRKNKCKRVILMGDLNMTPEKWRKNYSDLLPGFSLLSADSPTCSATFLFRNFYSKCLDLIYGKGFTTNKKEIITEKEGYTFEPITLEAKGEIIPPIAIWSKKQSENLIS